MDGLGFPASWKATCANSNADRSGVGSEVPARLRLYRAENISRAAALIFAISPGFAPRLGRRSRADVGVQRDGLHLRQSSEKQVRQMR